MNFQLFENFTELTAEEQEDINGGCFWFHCVPVVYCYPPPQCTVTVQVPAYSQEDCINYMQSLIDGAQACLDYYSMYCMAQ